MKCNNLSKEDLKLKATNQVELDFFKIENSSNGNHKYWLSLGAINKIVKAGGTVSHSSAGNVVVNFYSNRHHIRFIFVPRADYPADYPAGLYRLQNLDLIVSAGYPPKGGSLEGLLDVFRSLRQTEQDSSTEQASSNENASPAEKKLIATFSRRDFSNLFIELRVFLNRLLKSDVCKTVILSFDGTYYARIKTRARMWYIYENSVYSLDEGIESWSVGSCATCQVSLESVLSKIEQEGIESLAVVLNEYSGCA